MDTTLERPKEIAIKELVHRCGGGAQVTEPLRPIALAPPSRARSFGAPPETMRAGQILMLIHHECCFEEGRKGSAQRRTRLDLHALGRGGVSTLVKTRTQSESIVSRGSSGRTLRGRNSFRSDAVFESGNVSASRTCQTHVRLTVFSTTLTIPGLGKG